MIRITSLANDKNRILRWLVSNNLLRAWVLFCSISTVLMSGLVTACQPPASSANNEVNGAKKTPIIIDADSVTMTPEYILDVKPSRYQPSLGLQGKIEPIQQAQMTAAQDLQIQKVLVTKGQWVEKDTPLLIVQRQKLDDSIVADTASSNPTTETDSAALVSSKPSADTQTDNSNDQEPTLQEVVNSKNTTQPITIRASFSGRVDSVYVETGQHVGARERLLHLSDDTDLRFVATLPIQAESQLSVGQNVNFTAPGMTDKFTGQVSKLTINRQIKQLLVYVHVVKNEASRGTLKPNIIVTGRVDYGQIEVGTIVPKHGIHDVDLTEIQKPPYRPLSPLTANVWTIKQDQRLTRQPVEVIEYDPSTGQYLIAGVSNDSLICLVNLPLESAGKKVVIS